MDRDYEKEALATGWHDDYEGDDKVDAKTFVEKGEKVLGIVKGHRDELKSQVETQDRRIEELESANRVFGAETRKKQDKLRQENKTLLAQLKEKQATAVTESDGQAFTQTQTEIDKVESDLNKPVENPVEAAFHQAAKVWEKDNEWFGSNPVLSDYADGVANRLQRQGGWTDQSYFEEITREVKKAFPGEFTNPNRQRSNGVETGASPGTEDSKARSYNNLPDFGKTACDEYVKNGFGSKEDYCNDYEGWN